MSSDERLMACIFVGTILGQIYLALGVLVICYVFYKKYTLGPDDAKQARASVFLFILRPPLLYLTDIIESLTTRCLHSIGASNRLRTSIICILCIIGVILLVGIFFYYMWHEDDVVEPVAYNYLYKCSWVNGDAPPHIYNLNSTFNHTKCSMCIEPLNDYEDIILHCGHRHHSHCLRKWELAQLEKNPYVSYKCPICKTQYNWKQKWRCN
eukprot:145803_1